MVFDHVLDVDIDNGDFKYILIELKNNAGGNESKCIVRGYKRCPYHADVLDETRKENGMKEFLLEVLGGGRINHDVKRKEIVVYGESQQFGPADHQKTVELIKKKFADYNVSVSHK